MLARPILLSASRRALSTTSSPRVAIVGAGPAGFYTAHKLLKSHPSVHIDLLERLPAPYGLVRYGVAPDHPEVKNVIHTFSKVAESDRVRFFGNVSVGQDVEIAELQQAYSAVVLSYGAAAADNALGVPGEDLRGVVAARELVAWYNGHPDCSDLEFDLTSTDTAVVLGHGNVALDVARILLTSVDALRGTDISERALATLANSTIRHVHVVGRRGPVQAAFTAKELREMLALPGVAFRTDADQFRALIASHEGKLDRPRTRLMGILDQALAKPQPENADRSWALEYLQSPTRFLGTDRVSGVECVVNELVADPKRGVRAVPTAGTRTIDAGLAVKAIGYRAVPIPGHAFADGVVPNSHGKVGDGVYVAGWLKRGPVGTIATTMQNAYETAEVLLSDWARDGCKSGEGVEGVLKARGVDVVDWPAWQRIEKVETERGGHKVVDREEMLRIALG
ncbi:hypothetical protein AMAG_06620 [Allomyces macrogynus ATCC 38327]|uniref:NADPH:adrenodoxin oxidoreductase, mitochondrial n=1 Tax=Allomyces macrogynus (strain ATCC 38327) TaxID=578462 RepID=A0A0L0SEN4_ALLM3|nr:hypothetical protein AMAG_06620 [Allomyces macrogynus ATCC 38327]|eukprot:KNE60855.1 hypothetical protein AMAG_06620 [Allomyces macrogynus ATCC 38327]